MRFKTSSRRLVLTAVVSLLLSSLVLVANVLAQETTGGLQGTVKDATGAVVSSAHVEVTGTSLDGFGRLLPFCKPAARHLRPCGYGKGFQDREAGRRDD
jgi:hypothetical protein